MERSVALADPIMERQRRAGAVRRSLLTTVRAVAIGAGTMRSYGDGVLDGVRIERFDGPRAEVRWLFQIAEDSEENRDGYIDDGDVLVAVLDERPVGVLQITETGVSDELEINVLAVDEELQRHGIGWALVEACLTEARGRGCTRVLVSTGAADVGNLRFYQRCGFRMLGIERDAFTPDTGYPDAIMVDGVRLWDRVWFDFDLTHPPVTLS